MDLENKYDTIPYDYVVKSYSGNNLFFRFLSRECHVSRKKLEAVQARYLIGSTKDGGIIYWQIDYQLNVRTGKVMHYDEHTGHKLKNGNAINWIHAILKKKHLLSQDFILRQCLFGEHLLYSDPPEKTVALVEAEKTALLGAIVFPNYTWVSVGGKENLNANKVAALTNRNVVVFPDADAYGAWKEAAKHLFVCRRVEISDLLERTVSQEEREKKIDIGDLMIDHLQKKNPVDDETPF